MIPEKDLIRLLIAFGVLSLLGFSLVVWAMFALVRFIINI